MESKTLKVQIDLKSEVEERLSKRITGISTTDVLHRVTVFNCDGDEIIDCRIEDASSHMGRLAAKLNANHIVKIANSLSSQITSTTSSEFPEKDAGDEELFQNVLVTIVFGFRLIIIRNKLLGIACLSPILGDLNAQKLAARYYFSNFWAEFTVEVLQEFKMCNKAKAAPDHDNVKP